MDTVAVPACVQVTPSDETYPVIVSPTRVSRTQYGATRSAVVVVLLDPPVLVRRMESAPDVGVTAMRADLLPPESASRIITAARAPPAVFSCVATRAGDVRRTGRAAFSYRCASRT